MNRKKNLASVQKKIAAAVIILIFSLIIADLPAAAFAEESDLPHTIFVTFNGDPHSRRGFTWMTNKPELNFRLEICKKPSFEKAVSIASSSYSISGGDRTDKKIGNYGITKYGHKAVASGLTPGTKYYYRIGIDGAWSKMGSFTTEKTNCNEFSFIDVTDTQAAAFQNNNDYFEDWSTSIFEAFHKDKDASFFIDNGDIVNNGGDLIQWQAFADSAKLELMNTTFVPVAGNHETYEADKIIGTMKVTNKYGSCGICGSYKDAVINHFNLKFPSTEKNVHEGAYYSFDYGNTRFIILNTNYLNSDGTLSSEQVNWLNAECRNCKQKWKIVSMHRAVESDGENMAQPEIMALRSQLLKIMASDGVDLVLQGHDHIYLRSKQINKNGMMIKSPEKITEIRNGVSTTFEVNPKGTVYIIPGASNDEFCKNKYNKDSRNKNIALASKSIFIAKNIPSRNGSTLNQTSYSWLGSPAFADIKISGGRLYFTCYQYNTTTGHLKVLDSYAIIKADAKEKSKIANRTAPIKKTSPMAVVSFVQKNSNIIIPALILFAVLLCLFVMITRKKHR